MAIYLFFVLLAVSNTFGEQYGAGTNLAFQKICSQSSTYNYLGAAENAVDGHRSTNYMTKHCTHTGRDVKPWWSVDLTIVYNVTKVRITNRGDCCSERINGAEIRIGLSSAHGGTRNPKCATISSLDLGEEGVYECGNVGQYLTITIPDRAEHLTLCEVKVYGHEVSGIYANTHIIEDSEEDTASEATDVPETEDIEGINLAFRRISSQSSTYNHLGAAENAVDGHSSTDYMTGHCTHTSLDAIPWWSVDLTIIYNVTKVKITNRGDCCSHRISGAEIRIGLSSAYGGTRNPKCATISSLGLGEEGVYECGKVGRYLTITIPNRAEYLTLCEVRVYGHEVSGIDATAHIIEDSKEDTASEATDVPETANKEGTNLAFRRISSQSSTYNHLGAAENAVNGHRSTNYMTGHCTHTGLDVKPWWSVDLTIVYNVTTVKITNRGDCCSERINGAEIRIGLSSKHGGARNPKCAAISSLDLGEEGVYECGKVGRYLTITIPNRAAYLTLCEVKAYGHEVSGIDATAHVIEDSEEDTASEATDVPETEDKEGINLAFQRISSQSSTYNHLGAAENAVDGHSSTNYMTGHCTHTDLNVNPWWNVDLTIVYKVTTVKITNRGDCCSHRINGAEIRIGLSSDHGGTKNPKCATISSLGLGEEGVYECGMVGRYLTITIPDRAEYLTLCEVKVYGHKVSGINTTAHIIKDSEEDTASEATDVPETEDTEAPEATDVPETEDTEAAHVTEDREEDNETIELRNILKHSKFATNVALQGVASQSSIDGGYPGNAIDGSLKNIVAAHQCAKTETEYDSWWTLDLKSDHKISSISVTSGADCCNQDLDGAEIHIGASATGWKKNPICGTISSIGLGETVSFHCDGMEGRFVTIVVPGKIRSLTLCAVQVFGVSTDTPSINLAFRRISSQSSTYDLLGAAENAVDGHSNTRYKMGHCSHTGLDVNPWWSVDLTIVYNVTTVKITNRGGCCSERINGAEIRIGLSSEHGGTKNPKCATISSLGLGEKGVYECGKVGRYLTITIPDRAEYLTLCEVRAYGHKVSGIDATTYFIEDSEEDTGKKNVINPRVLLWPEKYP